MRIRTKVALIAVLGLLTLGASIVLVAVEPASGNVLLILLLGGTCAMLATLTLLVLRDSRNAMQRTESLERLVRKVEGQMSVVASDRSHADLKIERTLESLSGQLEAVGRTLRPGPGGLRHQLRHEVSRDVAAHLALHDLAPSTGAPVPLTSYSALPWTVLALAQEVLDASAGAVIVELGSGTSTLWMALTAKRASRSVRIISIDHSDDWAAHTRKALVANGVEHLVELRVVPLTALPAGNGLWYDLEAISDLDNISLLFIDGPPGSTSERARLPAVEMLAQRMASDCVVVVDDTNRPDEKASVHAWQDALSGQGVLRTSELERTVIIERKVGHAREARR